jgi:hypothetical protein
VRNLAVNEWGHVVLMTALTVVDDTQVLNCPMPRMGQHVTCGLITVAWTQRLRPAQCLRPVQCLRPALQQLSACCCPLAPQVLAKVVGAELKVRLNTFMATL